MAIKSLHLTNYWHERSGGIATFYRHLMAAAEVHQHRMILVVPGEQDEIVDVGAYCRIHKIAAPASPFNREYRTIYPRQFLFPESKLQRILATERPDLVELCDKYSLVHLGPLLRLRLLRNLDIRPVVVGLSCERMDDNFATYVSDAWWGPAFARFYMRHVYFPAFDHHIAVSARTAAELKDVANGHLVPRGVWIRPMGVDVAHFSPAKRSLEFRRQLLSRFDVQENAILLLYVGRLVPEKNLDLLLETMTELEKTGQAFRLVIAGDGISRESLQSAADSRLPGKVAFLGHVSNRDELAALYASCDAFIHPNPAEPFGIAPLEAMASGLPLVAPDRGGVTAYANAENSYLAPPNAEAFARAALSASQSGLERERKSQLARQTAESLAWPKVTESFLRLYEDIHRLANHQLSIEDAQPAFISSPANRAQAGRLRFAAAFARRCFLGYARAHELANNFVLAKRVCHQSELKDIRTP